MHGKDHGLLPLLTPLNPEHEAAACVQGCANILQHTCVASEGQSGAGMWDTASRKIHSILTGKVMTHCSPWTADTSGSFFRALLKHC